MNTNLTEVFKDAGIPSEQYQRGPSGKDVFIIRQQSGRIKFWPGNATFKTRINQKNRQVLLTVRENERTVVARTRHMYGKTVGINPFKINTLADALKLVSPPRRSDFRIRVPSSKMVLAGFKVVRNIPHFTVEIIFTAKFITKPTTTTFLLGFDESASKYPFICQLKKNVSNFKDAYNELKPVGITLQKGYKRQGEWFFNPVSKEVAKEVFNNSGLWYEFSLNQIPGRKDTYRPDSSHWGYGVRYNGTTYVIGKVKDRRIGRHSPLILTRLHSLHRNNEVIARDDSSWD